MCCAKSVHWRLLAGEAVEPLRRRLRRLSSASSASSSCFPPALRQPKPSTEAACRALSSLVAWCSLGWLPRTQWWLHPGSALEGGWSTQLLRHNAPHPLPGTAQPPGPAASSGDGPATNLLIQRPASQSRCPSNRPPARQPIAALPAVPWREPRRTPLLSLRAPPDSARVLSVACLRASEWTQRPVIIQNSVQRTPALALVLESPPQATRCRALGL